MIVVYTPMDGEIKYDNGARGADYPSFRFRLEIQETVTLSEVGAIVPLKTHGLRAVAESKLLPHCTDKGGGGRFAFTKEADFNKFWQPLLNLSEGRPWNCSRRQALREMESTAVAVRTQATRCCVGRVSDRLLACACTAVVDR